jgi:hypothetical protein
MVSGKAQNEREMDYKDHQIEVSVQRARDGSGWMPDVFITYYENGKGVLKSPRIDQTFATSHEAERAGVDLRKSG